MCYVFHYYETLFKKKLKPIFKSQRKMFSQCKGCFSYIDPEKIRKASSVTYIYIYPDEVYLINLAYS